MTKLRLSRLALPAVMLAALSVPAAAGPISKSAPSGKAVEVDHYTGWNDDCSFLEIKVDIVTRPANGTLTPRVAAGRIPPAVIGTNTSCVGRPTRVLKLFYRSAPGYRGTDSFSVNMRTVRSAPKRFDYVVTVR